MTQELHPALFWLIQFFANGLIFWLAFQPKFPAWLTGIVLLYWWFVVTEIGPKGKMHPVGWWVVRGWPEKWET